MAEIPYVEKAEVRIPYNLTTDGDDLTIHEQVPLNVSAVVSSRLRGMDPDEVARVVLAAAVLYEHTPEEVNIWTCLYEAIVWERG